MNPSIISHVSLGVNDFAAAVKFYDYVLPTVGAKRILALEENKAMAYGKYFPEFWINGPLDKKPATVGNGTHVSFLASSRKQVDAFYAAAVAAGAKDEGKPGVRPEYSNAYYGCFLRDLDGHKIEAMYWDSGSSSLKYIVLFFISTGIVAAFLFKRLY